MECLENPRGLIWAQLPLADPSGWTVSISRAPASSTNSTALLGPPKGQHFRQKIPFGGPWCSPDIPYNPNEVPTRQMPPIHQLPAVWNVICAYRDILSLHFSRKGPKRVILPWLLLQFCGPILGQNCFQSESELLRSASSHFVRMCWVVEELGRVARPTRPVPVSFHHLIAQILQLFIFRVPVKLFWQHPVLWVADADFWAAVHLVLLFSKSIVVFRVKLALQHLDGDNIEILICLGQNWLLHLCNQQVIRCIQVIRYSSNSWIHSLSLLDLK